MSPKLKHKKGRQVAPLAGAWIEIYYIMIIDNLRCVAPLAGAWIEIRITRIIDTKGRCRSPRGSVD